MVKYNDHYSNKSTVTWGMNGDKVFSVNVKLSLACSIYDCKNTTNYICEDPVYQYDWNKLWGKARCGLDLLIHLFIPSLILSFRIL